MDGEFKSDNILSNVSFRNVKINDIFWMPRIASHRNTTIKQCIEMCEKTGRIANFSKASGNMEGEFEGIYFNDSDVYKVLEGIAYTLSNSPDQELEKIADDIIDKIEAAQEEDGYINTYFTLTAPDKKWTDMEKHEDYCIGHLIEAAIAYFKATGKKKLLNAACRAADHMDSIFGPGKKHWVIGHEEPELALVKLYDITGEKRYLNLAKWFIEERGYGHGRGMIWDKKEWGPKYCQDDKPVRDMTDISGHAVRAMYLYCGVADVAKHTGDQGYIDALKKLWESVVYRNMYLTGGIGSSKFNEGFTKDYDLPNDTAYCETCASVGMVYWNHRMNMMSKDARYADIMERAMYNGALAGVSLDGQKFFYVNPLESEGNHHREEWYGCSCCPTQISRFIPSIGDYIYSVSRKEVYINLFIGSESNMLINDVEVKITQTTDYPWDGKVDFIIETSNNSNFKIFIRYPGWCRSLKIMINDEIIDKLNIINGYIVLERVWKTGDKIVLSLDMPVEIIHSNPKIKANIGKAALQRGPLVYCVEEVDNSGKFDDIKIFSDTKFLVEYDNTLLNGINVIKAINPGNNGSFMAIPYYAWDNRTCGAMKVWLDYVDNNTGEFRAKA